MRQRRSLVGLQVLLIVLSVASIAAAAEIAVYPSGESFATIQEAIDAADPGSTILIPEGVYRGNLVITKPLTIFGLGSITFESEDPAQPAIKITDTSDVSLVDLHVTRSGTAFEISNSSCRLDSCTIDVMDVGVKILSMPDNRLLLQGCVLTGETGVGVQMLGSGTLEMVACEFIELGTGVMLAGTTSATISRCSFDALFDGLVISETARATLIRNDIEDCVSGIRIAEVPFEAPAGSIVLVENEFEVSPGSAISMCGVHDAVPFFYDGELGGFGNDVDGALSELCIPDGYPWPEGFFVQED